MVSAKQAQSLKTQCHFGVLYVLCVLQSTLSHTKPGNVFTQRERLYIAYLKNGGTLEKGAKHGHSS
jgi:hypothetical protein